MNPAPPTGVVSVRQAVCDASRAVIGYEVLTGDPDAPPASARFCARALLEAFTDVDLDLVAPHHPAYLTVAPALLLRLDMLPISPTASVLQIETAATIHEEVVAAVTRLAGYGYSFAAVDPPSPAALSHLPEIGIVRLDMANTYPIAVGGRVRPFLAAGFEVHAVGVESFQVFEACVDAGCHAFQGPSAPCPRSTRRPPSSSARWPPPASCSRRTSTASASRRSSPATSSSATACCATPTPAFFKRRREIGTVREAITLIGERMTRRWALVVALAGGGARPDELLTDALVRARTMELVAADLPGLNADHAFTVGLFSMLPSLVNRPMEYALSGLGLPADIEDALLDGRPPYGALLDRLVCHLDGAFVRGEGAASFDRIDEAYRAALAWVEPLRKEVERGAAAVAA